MSSSPPLSTAATYTAAIAEGAGVALPHPSFHPAFAAFRHNAVPDTARVTTSNNAELGLVRVDGSRHRFKSELPWGLLTDRWGEPAPVLLSAGYHATWRLALMALLGCPRPRPCAPACRCWSAGLLLSACSAAGVNGSSGRE